MSNVSLGHALKSGMTAAVFAIIFNVVLFETVVFFSHLPFLVPYGPEGKLVEMNVFMIVFGCLMPALVASLLFWVLAKATKYGVRIFSVIAYAVLTGSLYPVLMLSSHVIEKTVLVLMHLITAGLIIRKLKKAERDGVTTSEPAQTIQPMNN